MDIADFLSPSHVAADIAASSKKRVLETLSQLLASDQPHLSEQSVFESLLARERLGGTGLGHGVAIPHGRLPGNDAINGAFVKLSEPIDYDAIDNRPVDLVFALLVPDDGANEHIQTLAKLAEMFSDQSLLMRLRNATSDEELFENLVRWEQDAAG